MSAGAPIIPWCGATVQAYLRPHRHERALWVGRNAFVAIDGDELRDRSGPIPRVYPLRGPSAIVRRIRSWQRRHPQVTA